MNKKLEILRILNNMMLPFVMASVLFRATGMEGSTAMYAGNLLLTVFVLISELVQYLFSGIVPFFLGHGAGIVLCTYLSVASGTQNMGFTIVRAIIMVAITVIAINAKLGKGVYFYPAMPEAFLFVAMMIACKLAKAGDAQLLVLLCEIFWGILAVIFYNTRQTAAAVSVFKERARVPYESILGTNRLMLVIYIGISMVFMALCVFLDYGKEIMDAVGAVMIRFLKWLFSLFDYTIMEEEYLPPPAQGQGELALHPMGYDDSYIRILWDVLFGMLTIVVAIGFVIAMVKAVMFFIRYFNEGRIGIRDRLSRDKVEYLKPAFQEETGDRDGRKENRIPLAARLSNRGQVRLLYKRFVKKGAGFEDVRSSHTPEEQLRAAYSETGNSQDIRKLYEKARYSKEEISSEDVRQMRKMSR